METPPSILITGSNRGLGLEWARQYAEAGWRVYATCRYPDVAEDLHELAKRYERVSIHQLDVTHAEDVVNVAERLAGRPLDRLVNNAGIYLERWGRDHLGEIDYVDWLQTYRVNVLGAVRVTEALMEALARSEQAVVAAISSHMGSISEIASPSDYAYRSSKAALNAVFRGLSFELGQQQIGVLLFHPGWVRTRMGGKKAPITPEQSVGGMRALMERFTPEMSGRFYKFDGSEMPW